MPYVPSDPYAAAFVTSHPTTGAATATDAHPVATATRNGVDDPTFVLTVAALATGRYVVTGTIPAGYASGDALQLSVAATVAGVAGVAVIDTQVLDGKRVSTLADYAGGDTPGTTTLLARLTALRSAAIDFLDVAVSSRLAAGAYTAPDAQLTALNALLTAVAVTATAIQATTDERLAAAVSTRLAAAAYTPPLDAAGHRAAIGLAAASMDTQLAAIAAMAAALTSGMQQGEPLPGFSFSMLSSNDHVTPLPSLVVSASRSLAGAAFAPCANAVVELASGAYTLDLEGSDLDARVVLLRLSADEADDRFVTFVLEPSA